MFLILIHESSFRRDLVDNAKYSTHDVKHVCEAKLGINFRDGKEYNGWFEYAGKRLARITIPHGRKPIPPKTYKSMALQLKIDSNLFDRLLACPLSLDEYISIVAPEDPA